MLCFAREWKILREWTFLHTYQDLVRTTAATKMFTYTNNIYEEPNNSHIYLGFL